MRTTTQWTIPAVTAAMAMVLPGCSKEEPKPAATTVQSAESKPARSAPVAVPTKAPEPSATPRDDCPPGSSGEGTFRKPCDGSGATRLMEVAWTGKTDDQGPHFRVVNKSKSVILFGKLAVYFYDKAGKQLEVKDASGSGTKPYHTCSGNMFGGVMKAGEKAVLTFSCVKKEVVPEGTAAIEAEMPMVGFAEADEKKVEYYWRNQDLAPDERKKGGIKPNK